MPTPSTIVVMLDPDFGFSSRVVDGVRREVRRDGVWKLLPLTTAQDDLLRSLAARGQVAGVIGAFLSDRWVGDFLEHVRIPIVNVGDVSRIRSAPSVLTDNPWVGRLAARHLRETGVSVYGVACDPASHASRLREEGFCAELAAAGVADVLKPPRSSGYALDDDWGSWAALQQRPLGMFCTDDFLARRFVRRVLQAGLRVPEDVAVVGAGDSPLDTTLSPVPLSSVIIPAERIGREAVRLLASLRKPTGTVPDRPPPPVLLPPEGVAVRESSSIRQGVRPLVSRALVLLRTNLNTLRTVAELSRLCHASRRSLETAFRHDLHRSPGEELRRLRMDRARWLLEGTSLSLGDVAEQCGFQNESWFWTSFRRETGLTPLQYRRNHGNT